MKPKNQEFQRKWPSKCLARTGKVSGTDNPTFSPVIQKCKQEGMQVRLSETYLFPVKWQDSLSKADLTGELCSRCVTSDKNSR